jgi:hypothetical protein
MRGVKFFKKINIKKTRFIGIRRFGRCFGLFDIEG